MVASIIRPVHITQITLDNRMIPGLVILPKTFHNDPHDPNNPVEIAMISLITLITHLSDRSPVPRQSRSPAVRATRATRVISVLRLGCVGVSLGGLSDAIGCGIGVETGVGSGLGGDMRDVAFPDTVELHFTPCGYIHMR